MEFAYQKLKIKADNRGYMLIGEYSDSLMPSLSKKSVFPLFRVIPNYVLDGNIEKLNDLELAPLDISHVVGKQHSHHSIQIYRLLVSLLTNPVRDFNPKLIA